MITAQARRGVNVVAPEALKKSNNGVRRDCGSRRNPQHGLGERCKLAAGCTAPQKADVRG